MKRLVCLVACALFALSCAAAQVFYIYGGARGEVFLGALNTNKYDSDSIWNQYGTYGSKYSSTSIWNKYGQFGGKYSQYSPFNPYSSTPPMLVDGRGNFYGYFTANRYMSRRANFSLVNTICEHWDAICDDVGRWYDRLFGY